MKNLKNILAVVLSFALLSCSEDKGPSGDAGWGDEPELPTSNVTVMSYNTRHCAPFEPDETGHGKDTPANIAGIAQAINNKTVDVVLLQEIDSCTKRSFKIDQAKELAANAKYPYHEFFSMMDYQGGKYGLAILSKTSIKDAVAHKLPNVINGHTLISQNNIVGSASIRVAGTDITFVVAHLSVHASDRAVQVQYIFENIIPKLRKPVIFGGDLNTKPTESVMAKIDSYGFVRTNKDPKNFTIPSINPNRELDYIAYFPETKFTVLSHKVIYGTTASDHLPILATLKINKK